jgi:hypothetical protein
MSKIYVKTDGPVPEFSAQYITPGKVYEVEDVYQVEGDNLGGDVVFDNGDRQFIYIPESSHLDSEPWTLCDQHGNPVTKTDWQAFARYLADVLQFIKRGNDCWCEANTADKRLGLHTHECNQVRLALAKYEQEVRA